MKILTRIGLALTLLITTACDAETNTTNESEQKATPPTLSAPQKTTPTPKESTHQDSCKISPDAFTNITDQVLVFTDVEPISNFKSSNASFGKYSSETGGAGITLQISQQNDSIFIERTYAEPGLTPEKKTYSDVCITDSLVFGEGVRGKFVNEGFLWLELNSGNDFIPADLWYLLDKQN